MTAMIRFRFERGGGFAARLRPDLAPETVEAVMAMLPIETTVYHSRWSGREINFPVKSSKPVPRERQTCTVNTGDVIYWKEWEMGAEAQEALAIYYGAEVTRDHRGYLPVNVFAQVPQQEWQEIEKVGLRIWKEGVEKLTVSRVSEEAA
ncbi:cyclophilin-like fold protein [Candidatus Bipolaricaulota bacterium]